MHFFNSLSHTGWMQLNKHYVVCAFKIIMCWQVQALINSPAANLSFSSFLVFGSVKMIEPLLDFRHGKLWSLQCLLKSGSQLIQGHTIYLTVCGSGSDDTCLPVQNMLSRYPGTRPKKQCSTQLHRSTSAFFVHCRSFSRELAVLAETLFLRQFIPTAARVAGYS